MTEKTEKTEMSGRQLVTASLTPEQRNWLLSQDGGTSKAMQRIIQNAMRDEMKQYEGKYLPPDFQEKIVDALKEVPAPKSVNLKVWCGQDGQTFTFTLPVAGEPYDYTITTRNIPGTSAFIHLLFNARKHGATTDATNNTLFVVSMASPLVKVLRDHVAHAAGSQGSEKVRETRQVAELGEQMVSPETGMIDGVYNSAATPLAIPVIDKTMDAVLRSKIDKAKHGGYSGCKVEIAPSAGVFFNFYIVFNMPKVGSAVNHIGEVMKCGQFISIRGIDMNYMLAEVSALNPETMETGPANRTHMHLIPIGSELLNKLFEMKDALKQNVQPPFDEDGQDTESSSEWHAPFEIGFSSPNPYKSWNRHNLQAHAISYEYGYHECLGRYLLVKFRNTDSLELYRERASFTGAVTVELTPVKMPGERAMRFRCIVGKDDIETVPARSSSKNIASTVSAVRFWIVGGGPASETSPWDAEGAKQCETRHNLASTLHDYLNTESKKYDFLGDNGLKCCL